MCSLASPVVFVLKPVSAVVALGDGSKAVQVRVRALLIGAAVGHDADVGHCVAVGDGVVVAAAPRSATTLTSATARL